MEYICWSAVLVAAVVAFVIGGLWYSALFANAWMKACGFGPDDLKGRNMGMVFGTAFVMTLVWAFGLAWAIGWIGHACGPGWFLGAKVGGVLGVSFSMMSFGIVAQFEKRSCSYALINGGYFVVSSIAMGAIIGIWGC